MKNVKLKYKFNELYERQVRKLTFGLQLERKLMLVTFHQCAANNVRMILTFSLTLVANQVLQPCSTTIVSFIDKKCSKSRNEAFHQKRNTTNSSSIST